MKATRSLPHQRRLLLEAINLKIKNYFTYNSKNSSVRSVHRKAHPKLSTQFLTIVFPEEQFCTMILSLSTQLAMNETQQYFIGLEYLVSEQHLRARRS